MEELHVRSVIAGQVLRDLGKITVHKGGLIVDCDIIDCGLVLVRKGGMVVYCYIHGEPEVSTLVDIGKHGHCSHCLVNGNGGEPRIGARCQDGG